MKAMGFRKLILAIIAVIILDGCAYIGFNCVNNAVWADWYQDLVYCLITVITPIAIFKISNIKQFEKYG